MPRSREHYWGPKLAKNVARDKENHEKLTALGWQVITIWECELKDPEKVEEKLISALRPRIMNS